MLQFLYHRVVDFPNQLDRWVDQQKKSEVYAKGCKLIVFQRYHIGTLQHKLLEHSLDRVNMVKQENDRNKKHPALFENFVLHNLTLQ